MQPKDKTNKTLTGQDGIRGRSSCVQLSAPTLPTLTSKPSLSPLPTEQQHFYLSPRAHRPTSIDQGPGRSLSSLAPSLHESQTCPGLNPAIHLWSLFSPPSPTDKTHSSNYSFSSHTELTFSRELLTYAVALSPPHLEPSNFSSALTFHRQQLQCFLGAGGTGLEGTKHG